MNSDLEKAMAPYFDGTKSAKKTMYAIVSLDANNRTALRKYAFDWLEKKITSEQAIAMIRHAYNLQ